MISLDRWQYPWIGLALVMFGLSVGGYLLYDVGIVSLFPLLAGFGFLVIVARPEKFGYVMAGLGGVSVIIALLPADWSPLTRGVLGIVGIGTIVASIRSQRSRETDQW